MKPPPTFIDLLLQRDPLTGLVADLNRVLNAREPATGAPEMSLSELIDVNDRDEVKKLAKRIAKVIQHHDLRLVRVNTKATQHGAELHFEVTLYFAPQAEPVRLAASHANNRWQVRKGDQRR